MYACIYKYIYMCLCIIEMRSTARCTLPPPLRSYIHIYINILIHIYIHIYIYTNSCVAGCQAQTLNLKPQSVNPESSDPNPKP